MTKLKFPNQIFVFKAPYGPRSLPVFTCDTQEQAAAWLEKNADLGAEYTIDGTLEAWHEQFGYCGGSSICDCAAQHEDF